MEQFVIFLVILSALLHVYWNGLLKRSYDKHAFTWWLLLFSLLLFLPLALKFYEFSLEGFRFALLSGIIHAAYFLSLGYAYEEGELSLVYPIARSSPAIVPFLAYFLLGERVPLKGYLGISLVVLGIFMLNLHEISALGIENALRIFRMRSAIIAMITAWITSLYSIVDKLGVSIMNPVFYIYLMFFFSFLGVSIFVLTKKRALILCELMMNGRFVFISGALCMLSYLLILYAMRLTYLSYVIALRQIGVFLSLLIAVVVLRERVGKWRVFASATIFFGLLLISI
ncbi:MAG: EamA family transporter [Archaeoglobi archaeon]|nr:EamA family transporter [Candidatus Mnemosynella bozhongmuii]